MKRSFRITPAHDRLLRGDEEVPVGLYHVRFATAEQLTRLHYSPKSIKWVHKHLKALVDHGYVMADIKPTKGPRGPNFYLLTDRGLRYLASAGIDVREARVSSGTIENYLLIEHTLELNDLLIAAALLKRYDTRVQLQSFVHEHELKRRPYKASWQNRDGRTQTYTIIPSGLLTFKLRLSDGRVMQRPVLLEHDCGSEEQRHFRRRIRAYISLLKRRRPLPIAFTTFKGVKRLGQMREWAWQELNATNEPPALGSLFRFAAFEKPLEPVRVWAEPYWYTAYDDTQPHTLF